MISPSISPVTRPVNKKIERAMRKAREEVDGFPAGFRYHGRQQSK